jgi:bacillithiol system protein YtxJ
MLSQPGICWIRQPPLRINSLNHTILKVTDSGSLFDLIDESTAMKWNELTGEEQLQQIITRSNDRPQVIFKHSTRCGISAVAKSRLERWTPTEDFDFYYLDLIRYRQLSAKVAEAFEVYHESPQVLVIKNGECVYDESHLGISLQDILEHAA